jgi:GTP-binding protein
MAGGALLLVDAKEGPMPQTRFVLQKALEKNLKIIVVINKIDKADARLDHTLNKTFDLFVELGASDDNLDFPVIYASGRDGKAGKAEKLEDMQDISPIFEAILKYIPAPTGEEDKPLQISVSNIFYDNFKGRIAVGRIHNGKVSANQDVMHIDREGQMKKYRLMSLLTYFGLDKVEAASASCGDIVALAGIPDVNIGSTIADVQTPIALPLIDIEQPTIKMLFKINDSPFAGKEGEYTTSRQIGERLHKELETDVALNVVDLGPSL